MDRLRIALAQIDVKVGDLSGNTAQLERRAQQALELGADVVAFPELAITAYPPEDLLLRPDFIDDNLRCVQQLAARSHDIAIVVGFVDLDEDIYNAAAFLYGGEVRGVYHKRFLPNYSVFDEERYFQHGDVAYNFRLAGADIGVNICEDIWYPAGPADAQALAGAEMILNLSASPYRRWNPASRERMLMTRAQDNSTYVCFVNMVGGQDELVFDGASVVIDPSGRVIARAPMFQEDLLIADLDTEAVLHRRLHDPRARKLALARVDETVERVNLGARLGDAEKPPIKTTIEPMLDETEEMYEALKLALRDYVRKTGFERVVVGLSGGIDSSLVATIASDALGRENVVGVSMPSRYSSEGSRTDAEQLARNLGIEFLTIPIEQPFQGMLDALSEVFEGTEPGIAEENLQARARGNILMALSNKFGWLVLATGNKSEMAVGYSTLYGDLAGGYALIKDVPKTLVYALARYRNDLGHVIPDDVLTKPPSAELRPGQTDQQSLPPYDVLDGILELYIEADRSPDEIIADGYDADTVRRVVRMVDRAEYKRRQAPPGPKVTPRAFGRDRRLPIVNGYR